MISSDMARVLEKIPRAPETITLAELQAANLMNISLLSNILQEAIDCHYVNIRGRNVYSDVTTVKVCIAEEGKVALEEFKDKSNASKKSTWALIIAGLSFISSVIAIIISCL